jgi:heptosyltransferase-2
MFNANQVERVVIRMPNWVGDVVMATPAIRAVRDTWPRAKITALCLPSGQQILSSNPHLDHFEVYDRKGRDSGFFGMGRMARRLRARNCDLAIALPNSFSSALLFWRAGIPHRLGTDYGKRGFLLTERYRPEMDGQKREPRPMVEHYADLLQTIGIERPTPDLELFESDRGKYRATVALSLLGAADGDKLVAINPGASFGPTKLWETDRFAAVADRLKEEHGLTAVLIGGPGEEGMLHEIARKMKTTPISTADDLLDLDALKTAIRLCSLMVTTDAGPRHYAVAMGIPVVVLMGPTDPRYTQSSLEKTTVLRVEDLECSPCHLKNCPLAHRHCMTLIDPDQVMAACADLLERFPPTALSGTAPSQLESPEGLVYLDPEEE